MLSWPQWIIDAACTAYRQGVTLEEIAIQLNRKIGSVRFRLVREGVYISKSNVTRVIRENRANIEGF